MKLIYGVVEQQDLSAALHKYRVRLSTGELSPWMPALVFVAGSERGNQSLSLNTQVCLVMDDYEGIVLGAVNSQTYPATTDKDTLNRSIYSDGAVIEYDSLNHQLNAVLPSGATSSLICDGGITIVGDIDLTGNITQTGDITQTGKIVSTDDHIAGGISLINHVHTGDSGGTTSKPQ